MNFFKLLIFSYLLLFFVKTYSQELITINSQTTGDLTTCLDSVKFEVFVENPSPFLLQNITATINLPTGVEYIPNSFLGGLGELNISNLSSPSFSLDSLSTLQSKSFYIYVKANCNVVDFINSGAPIINDVLFDFNAVNSQSNTIVSESQTHQSDPYNILTPNVSITNITNQSYSGSVGNTFNRCITIVNGGNGVLTELTLQDTHGNGVNISNINIGNVTTSGNTKTIILSALDFATVGNGDNFLDPGEEIIICETIEIVSCSDVSSSFSYYWGCLGSNCQILYDAANVIFPGEVPNLTFTTGTDYSSTSSNGACYGNNSSGDFGANIQIQNNGTGTAYNVEIDLFQGWGNGMYSNNYSSLNTNSFTITKNSSTPQPITFDNTINSTTKPCLPSNPIGRVIFTIDSIEVGDNIRIDFNHYTCCYDNVYAGNSRHHLLSWGFKGYYYNKCNSKYNISKRTGMGHRYYEHFLNVESSPGTILGSSTETISFLNSRFGIGTPINSSNDLFRYEITLPTCLTMIPGSFNIKDPNGILITTVPDSITNLGNTINVWYSQPVGSTQSTVNFDVQLDCSSCGSLGNNNIELKTYYSPDLNCGCEMKLGSVETSIHLMCPTPCEGISLQNSIVQRVNYGLADNNNDGFPDPSGTIMDMNLVKTKRLMYGDTLSSYYKAVVNNPNNLNWNYIYANTTISDVGNRFAYENSSLTIYDASSSTYHICSNLSAPIEVLSGSDMLFESEITISNLIANGCLPSAYTLQTGDSVLFEIKASVNSNIGGAVLNGMCSNQIYASSVQNPTNNTDKFGCVTIQKPFTLIGYYFTNYGPSHYTVNSCNQYTASQYYYLSIGLCCSNYAGGNLFPYEYRKWASPTTLDVVMPDNYTFISARFYYRRTSGTFSTTSSPWFSLTPTSIIGNTYSFDVSSYFGDDPINDSIFNSDDGWDGRLDVVFEPNCSILDTTLGIGYNWYFNTVNQLSTSTTASNALRPNYDDITYKRPDLFLQSNLLSSNTATGYVEWDITISNNSNSSNSINTWLGGLSLGGITIDSLYDSTSLTMLYPNNNMFLLDTIFSQTTHKYRLYTNSTSCVKDSVELLLGWDCSGGYPTNISNYTCSTEKVVLSIIPWMPEISNTIQNTGSDTIQLCDTSEYIISVSNIQLGNLYNIVTSVILPNGMSIVSGSSEMSYPSSNSFIPISDPSFISGTTYSWNIQSLNSIIQQSGLSGILDVSANKYYIKFKCSSSCGYFSGDNLSTRTVGEASCGQNVGSSRSYTNNIYVIDALPTYSGQISINYSYISPCLGNNVVELEFINQGPGVTNSSDSIYFYTNSLINYVPNTFTPDLNSPINTIPNTITQNGENIYSWQIPHNLGTGDTCRFSIQINGLAEDLNCGIQQLKAKVATSDSAICISSGSYCPIEVLITDTIRNVFIYKSYLKLFDSTGSNVVFNPPLGETANIYFNVLNYGQDLLQGTNTVFQYYQDTDNNGVYSSLDTYITSDTIQNGINSGNVLNYNSNINIPSGNSCSIIAVLDTSINSCSCIPGEILIPLELAPTTTRIDTVLCSEDSILIGSDSVYGYSYTWSPSTNLSNSNTSNTIYTNNVNLNETDTTMLIREINRIGCISYDTTVVITYSPSIPNISIDSLIACKNDCIDINNQTLVSIYNPVVDWEWNIESSTNQINNSNQYPTICFNEDGTYSIQLIVKTQQGCIDTTDINTPLVVNPSPVAEFSIVPSDSIKQLEEISIIDESNGALIYYYNFGDGQESNEHTPSHIYEQYGDYNIKQIIENQYNCKDTSNKIVKVYHTVFVPNVFTPNGDNENEYFEIRNIDLYPDNTLIIFNRWGDKVFEAQPYTNNWNGKNTIGGIKPIGEDLVDGTYFYILQLSPDKKRVNGTVEIIRD